jgi:ABC-2 type transport system permease protein
MQREGSALSGVGTVFFKEMTDNLTSARMRLLEVLIFVTGVGAVYATIGSVKEAIGQDPFIFLRVFTLSKEPLPSFVDFLGFLIPIVAIALGFDSVNSEFNRRTMSRILAQPIYRDALLFGKFLSGLATLAVVLAALWLLVTGLGILTLGLPPSGEEVLRGLAFLVAAIAYGGVWLVLALMFSVIFRSAATAALAGLAIWLLFAFFWNMIVPIVTQVVAPVDPYDLGSVMHTTNVALAINRLSPNILFLETTRAFLEPSTQSLNPLLIFISKLQNAQNAIPGSTLPFGQSLVLVWPQLTGLVAEVIVLFSVTYVLFQRQEVRA